MEIGDEAEPYVIEPIEDPVPQEEPAPDEIEPELVPA
jgi:hypothetical protein